MFHQDEVVLLLLLLNVSPTENPINNTHYSGSSKDPLPWIVLRHEVAVKRTSRGLMNWTIRLGGWDRGFYSRTTWNNGTTREVTLDGVLWTINRHLPDALPWSPLTGRLFWSLPFNGGLSCAVSLGNNISQLIPVISSGWGHDGRRYGVKVSGD